MCRFAMLGFACLCWVSSPCGVLAQALAPGVNLVPVVKGYSVYNTASFNRHNLTTIGSTQYFGFYSAATNLLVARRTLGTTNWETYETSFKPNNPADGHDSVNIGVDGEGRLHASWGMHADAFHYARGTQAWSLVLVATNMTGNENAVTYPQFINLPSGDLLYLFREGGSGAGDTYLNRWSLATHAWTNVHRSGTTQIPFIKGTTGNSATDCNAYPNFACLDSHTNLFLTWCWREDASTIDSNHDQNYARSSDLGLTWSRWDSTPYVLPITKSNVDIIWPIATNSTLMNQCGMCLDTNERPVIATWWAPRGAGTALQIMVVWNDGLAWRTNQVTQRTTTAWMGRPIIVSDKTNRLFLVYRDPERGRRATLAWTADPLRSAWSFADLTTESLGGWEPVYDPQLWARDGKLHLFYQNITATTGGTMVYVLEFDPALFLSHLPNHATYEWNSAVTNGFWSPGANWTNGVPPPVGGSNNIVLSFPGTASLVVSNDLSGALALNALNLNNSATGTNLLRGNPLTFRPNGTALPAITQSGSAEFRLENPMGLESDLSLNLNAGGSVTLSGRISGVGAVSILGSGTCALLATNTYLGATSIGGGVFQPGWDSLGSGPLALSGGTIRWLPGVPYDVTLGRTVTLSGSPVFDPNGNEVMLAGTVGGSGSLTLTAPNGGALVLAGANTYAGATTVNSGSLVVASSSALGAAAGNTLVVGGYTTSSLVFQGGMVVAEPIRCGGRQPLPNASALAAHIINLSSTNTLVGAITAETGGNQYNLESAGGLLMVAGDYAQTAGTGDRYLNLQGAGNANWTGAISNGTAIVNVTKRGAGSWTLSGTNVYTGWTLAAEGSLIINGQVGPNSVTVSNGLLGGTGRITGPVTVQGDGVLAPGEGIGTLTVASNLAFAAGSTLTMEISKTPLTNDRLVVSRNLGCGGTLLVTNTGSTPLAAGDSFKLFSAGSFSNAFAAFVPAHPGSNLVWDRSTLYVDGTLRVAGPPRFGYVGRSPDGVVRMISFGPTNAAYHLWAATNLAQVPATWTLITTGVFTSGTFTHFDAQASNFATRFYRVTTP